MNTTNFKNGQTAVSINLPTHLLDGLDRYYLLMLRYRVHRDGKLFEIALN